MTPPQPRAAGWRQGIAAFAACAGVVLGAGPVYADAAIPAASALALSDADGTVHARGGVRVALSAAGGGVDRTAAFRPWVHGRMASLQQCFVGAMAQNSRVTGQLAFELRALSATKLEVKPVRDDVRDPVAAACVASALGVGGVAVRGARAQLTVTFDNPVVRLGVVDPRQRLAEVRVLGSGLAETTAKTQANEVQISVQASAYARAALAHIGARTATDLAGLLDCRRKASRRARPAQGTLTLEALAAEGHVKDVRVTSNSVGDRKSSACVSAWLGRLDVHDLEKVGFTAAVTFSK